MSVVMKNTKRKKQAGENAWRLEEDLKNDTIHLPEAFHLIEDFVSSKGKHLYLFVQPFN